MKVVIAGGNGFIGQVLTDKLIKKGYEIVIFTRNPSLYVQRRPQVRYLQWLTPKAIPEKALTDVDVVINLAGQSINSGRWSKKRKTLIRQSRIETTEEILRILRAIDRKPAMLVNASAIGYYDSSFTDTYTEESTTISQSFLGQTVQKWEQTASAANEMGMRTVYCRFGIVLGKKAGALPLMTLPYRLFLGGTIGSGNQWMSWIHVEDAVRAIIFIIENKTINGPVNMTAPNPVTNKQFGKEVSKKLHRPHWLPVPTFLLKCILGEKSELVLASQKVLPAKLLDAQFSFKYPTLQQALADIYQ